MSREIQVKLDGGRTATIRGFLRVRDSNKIQRALLGNQEFSEEQLEKDNLEKITVSGSGLLDSMEMSVKLLLLEYCGNTDRPFEALMDSEFSEDYEKIQNAAQKVANKGKDLPKK